MTTSSSAEDSFLSPGCLHEENAVSLPSWTHVPDSTIFVSYVRSHMLQPRCPLSASATGGRRNRPATSTVGERCRERRRSTRGRPWDVSCVAMSLCSSQNHPFPRHFDSQLLIEMERSFLGKIWEERPPRHGDCRLYRLKSGYEKMTVPRPPSPCRTRAQVGRPERQTRTVVLGEVGEREERPWGEA
jgi:hypothetical protein